MLARLLLSAALALAVIPHASAQTVQVVPDCVGVSGATGPGGRLYTDQTGKLCTVAVSQPSPSAAGGLVSYRVNNAAGSAAAVVKANPGRIYSYHLCNGAAAARYVRFYNAASGAVTGTSPITAGAILVPASGCQTFTTNFGLTFSAGISFSVTAANGDTDTTAATAGDVQGFIGYM